MFPLTAITTLAHLYALQVSPSTEYSFLIAANTSLSFLWHLSEEKDVVLAIFDHGLALVWGYTDLVYGYRTGHLFETVTLNFLVFALDGLIVYKERDSYVFWHSLWHLFSALKVFALASLFSSSQVV